MFYTERELSKSYLLLKLQVPFNPGGLASESPTILELGGAAPHLKDFVLEGNQHREWVAPLALFLPFLAAEKQPHRDPCSALHDSTGSLSGFPDLQLMFQSIHRTD